MSTSYGRLSYSCLRSQPHCGRQLPSSFRVSQKTNLGRTVHFNCSGEESLATTNGLTEDVASDLNGVEPIANEIALHPPGMNEENANRVSRYQAAKECSHAITEGDRPLSEYMTLPVSQYSVLDADKVERLDESTFRVQTSSVSFFRFKMTPVMTLTVIPHKTGCEVRLLECKLLGSKVVEDANARFACYMRNYVSYTKNEETKEMELLADCIVQVAGIVPRWISSLVPMKTVNRLGGGMLAKILDVAMPRFLQQLETDYRTWASGDDSRSAMSTGESFGLEEMLTTEAKENAKM